MTGFGRDAIETALIAAAQVRRKTFEGHFFRMAIDRVFIVKGLERWLLAPSKMAKLR